MVFTLQILKKTHQQPNLKAFSFDEVYEKELKIMDLTAITLCKENNLPIIVFDMNKSGNLVQVLKGENVGTLVKI